MLVFVGCSSEARTSDRIVSPSPFPDTSDSGASSDGPSSDVGQTSDAGGAADEGADGAAEAAVPTLVITPASAHVTTGAAQSFTASAAVSWSVKEAAGGTIDANGLYKAPDSPGTYHIVATHDGQTASADVIVVAPGLDLVAGSLGAPGSADGVGTDARFSSLAGVWRDPAGDLYLADTDNQTIRKMRVATAEVTTVTGSALTARIFSASLCVDGNRVDARFARPTGVLGDGSGNLYVSDGGCNTIRKVTLATGDVTTIAGLAHAGGRVDGVGADARFQAPNGLAWQATGTLLVGDGSSIRSIDVASGTVSTVAPSADQLINAEAVAIDGSGILYFTSGNSIQKFDIGAQSVTTWLGDITKSGTADGIGVAAQFHDPSGLALDGAGGLIIVDNFNHDVRRADFASATVTTLAGHPGQAGIGVDAIGGAASFLYPSGVALLEPGAVVVTENARVRRIDLATAMVSTIAGRGAEDANVDGAGSVARFTKLSDALLLDEGHVLVADTELRTIALVDGQTTTIPIPSLAPAALALDANDLYVASAGGTSVSKVDLTTRQATLIAGDIASGSKDGVGVDARFGRIVGLYADHAGHLFASDPSSCAIRAIDLGSATVTTIAGTFGKCTSTDGDRTTARFGTLGGIIGDGGHLYVSDRSAIRVVDPATGDVSTLAGDIAHAGATDDVGTAARFAGPWGLSFDASGNLLVADRYTSTLRKVEIATGRVTTILGAPGQQGVTLGPSSAARLNTPLVALPLPGGDFVVVDNAERTVLRMRY